MREAYNAVFVEADAAGRLMFYGAGPGAVPPPAPCSGTSSTVGPQPAGRHQGPGRSTYAGLPVLPISVRPGPATTWRLTWPTGPACWLRWREAFARHDVSIKAVRQEGRARTRTW